MYVLNKRRQVGAARYTPNISQFVLLSAQAAESDPNMHVCPRVQAQPGSLARNMRYADILATEDCFCRLLSQITTL